MKQRERLKIQDRALMLGILIQVLILVSQVFTINILAQQSYQASMVPTDGGETLQVHLSTDTGRPRGILDHITRYLRQQPWVTSSWLGAWLVGGVERTDAIVSISITVTGSNVQGTATVDYWVEGRPQGGGQAYRFLQATGQSVTVGGASLQASDDRGITAHLEAMGLSTDQTWPIDYYVYAKALTTGAVSGGSLTSEIAETKFDTKTYTYSDPGTWSVLAGRKIDNYAGFRSSTTYYAVGTDTDYRYFRVSLGYYQAYWAFRNDDTYGTKLPYVDPGTLIIHEAYIQMHSGRTTPSSPINIYIHGSHASWQGNWITSLSTFEDYWTNKKYPEYVTWNPPSLTQGKTYNTTSVASLVQKKLDTVSIGTNGALMFWFEHDGAISDQMYFYPWPAASGRLFVRWSGYTASWYPLPPLSLASLPITLDVVALSAIIGATILVWRENRRKMS